MWVVGGVGRRGWGVGVCLRRYRQWAMPIAGGRRRNIKGLIP